MDWLKIIKYNRRFADRFENMPTRFQVHECPRYSLNDTNYILGLNQIQIRDLVKLWRRPEDEYPSLYTEYNWGDSEISWFDLLLGQFLIDTRSLEQAPNQIDFIKALGEHFGEPYAVLSHSFWQQENREAIFGIQQTMNVSPSYSLVDKRDDGFELTTNASTYFQRLTFDIAGADNAMYENGFVFRMTLLPSIPGKAAEIEVTIARSGGLPILRNINIETIHSFYMAGGMDEIQGNYPDHGFTQLDIERVVNFSPVFQKAA